MHSTSDCTVEALGRPPASMPLARCVFPQSRALSSQYRLYGTNTTPVPVIQIMHSCTMHHHEPGCGPVGRWSMRIGEIHRFSRSGKTVCILGIHFLCNNTNYVLCIVYPRILTQSVFPVCITAIAACATPQCNGFIPPIQMSIRTTQRVYPNWTDTFYRWTHTLCVRIDIRCIHCVVVSLYTLHCRGTH